MTMTWTQRLNNIAHQRQKSQGFIWDSLDSSMEDLQIARNTRKNGPIRLITKRQDTSYNGIRSTLRLQYAEKRKSDLRNLVSSIRLSLDYDLYKARAMALLNSKARTIFWIMMDLVVDVLFCVLYLVDAQSLVNSRNEIDYNNPEYPNPPYLFVPRLWQVWVIAVAMSTWNLMSALIRFIFADNKLRFIFSFQTLLDAITAIPFLLSGFFLPYGQFLYVPYFLRSWSVISRLQRALSIGVDIGISDQPFDPVKAKLIGLVAYFIVILYNGMAAFLYCETMFTPKTENAHTVWDALYFILITASTVGYGDITPKSLEARIVVMIFIIVALSVVPGLIAGAIDTIKSSRSGGGSYIQSRSANGAIRQYLVMIGDFQSAKRVADMLNGFFNKEFSDNDVRVVFLSRNKPSKDVRTLLDMPSHKNRTTILVGNGLDESDLKRCQAKDAAGVFIIPDLTVSRKESQDTMTTLLAWSLHLHAPKTRIFTYNLLPETETFQWGIAEQTICISEVKQLLLAYSCRHRGTTTLILNLLYPSEPSNNYEDGWQAQYGDGTGNEIYTGPVPTVFVGWTFAQVSWFVFQEFQTILIGVDIFLQSSSTFIGMDWDGPHLHAAEGVSTDGISSNGSSKSHTRSRSPGRGFHNHESDRGVPSGKYHLTLNPGNSYRLGKYDHLVFIAQSPIDVESITKFTVDQYERLVRDEKGHLSESRNDFAYAMDMYYNLRETRTLARAAATKRANHRKDKKAKQAEMSLKTSMVNNYQKSQGFSASEKSLSSSHAVGIGEAGVRISTPPGRSIPSFRSKSGGFKKSRPAWNVALYDDDDDEDGESEESDSNNLKKIRGDQSRFSHHSSQSRNSNRSKGIKQDREPPMSALSREELITKTEPEEIPLSDTKEWSNPLSIYGQVHKNEAGSGNDGEQGSRNRMSRQFLSTSPPFEDKFYPTDYDRNAAAAAAEDAKNQEEQGISEEEQLDELTSPSIPAFNSNNLSAAVSPRLGVSIVTSELHGGSNSNIKDPFTPESSRMSASSNVRPALTPLIPNSQLPTFSQSASIHGSYKTLDESTYIGQTSVTRSETKDLPLCHLLLNPPDSIKPLLKDDLSNLKDHIVVCSDAGENLYRFLATLRLAQISREDLKTIVILTRNPIETFASDTRVVNDTEGAFDQGDDVFGNTANIGGNSATEGSLENCYGGYWDAILAFPRIYWVSGNCRHQRDLVRAGILGASSIVIMSHSVEGLDRDEFADSTAIMAHHMVSQILHQRGLLGRQNIVVDISERSNIRFLNMRNLNKINPSNNNSGKASNKTISNISRIGNGSSNNSFWMTPTFASGQVLVSSLLDNILFQSYSKTHILDLIKLCCGVRFKQAIELDQILGIDCSNICLIDCPVEYIGKSFLKLYQGLALLYGIIPLGLYRAPDFELNNAMPFVFSNPLPGIIVKGTDKIYVLKS
ncbi:Calcium-activated potassium channel subunit alpha-1 [Linnemannia zychae]|nr:Calcium-activated potassium channel subunit alpha-1 [Linnemannia zychae]